VVGIEKAGPSHAEAIRALIPFYEQAGDARKLAEAYAAELASEHEPAARKTKLERLARLHEERLDDPVTAFDWQLQAFESDPADGDGRARLERLTRKTATWPLLIDAYERAAAQVEPTARVALLAVVGTEKRRVLGDSESAIGTWRAILELDPVHAAALDALEELYAEARRYHELQAIYARKLELTSSRPAQLDLWCKMAALAEDEGDDVRALAAYRGVLEVAGDEPRALSALDRILERRGEWRELEAVLLRERALAPLPDAERRRLTFRLAELREHRLEDIEGAVALHRELISEEPTHPGARAALERHLARPGHEIETALLLEPIYAQLGETARLVEVQRIRVAHSRSTDEQVALLHTIARACERQLGNPDEAFAALSRALRIAPGERETFTELERLADLLRSWQPLVELYREVAARPLSIDQHVELRCRLARLYVDQLDDVGRALATFARVLDLRPDEPRALRGLGRFEEGEAAERAWRLLLSIEPDDPEALAALAALYEASERWSELAQVLEKQVRGAAGGPLEPVLSEQLALVNKRQSRAGK
jgi:tetratricopeptide (TPR) repeat protein